MASYSLQWKKSAVKELKRLPQQEIPRIVKAVENLAVNPFPVGCCKLAGAEHIYRIRVGVYRIIYSLLEPICTIEIIRVKHRKDVYR